MTAERIAQLLAPFVGGTELNELLLRQTGTYLDLLLKWNSKMNLTAVRDPAEIIGRHFGESFFAARHLFPAATSSVSASNTAASNTAAIDIGSGAGFPGLPLKLWAPSIELTLIESNQRKATFLREVIRALDLYEVAVLTERAEAVSAKADLVTLRAVEHFEEVLVVAGRLVNPGGRIAVLVGGQQTQTACATIPSARWTDPVAIPNSRNRVLLIGQL